MNVEIRYAHEADLKYFGARQERSMRALVIEKDGVPVAIAGLTFGDGVIEVFSDMKDVDVPKITIWKYSRLVLDMIKEWNMPMIAIASSCKMNSEKFLTKLGFTFVGEHLNKRIYRL